MGLGELDVVFQPDIGFTRSRVKKAPASGFKQLVDFDAGLGFLKHYVHLKGRRNVPQFYLIVKPDCIGALNLIARTTASSSEAAL